MKKKLLSITVLTSLMFFGVNAQQIENGGFEEGRYTTDASELNPRGYGSLNLDGYGFPALVGTEHSDTDPFEGDSIIVLTTTSGWSAIGAADVQPGYLFAGDVFVDEEKDAQSERLQSVMLTYKYAGLNDDAGYAYFELTNETNFVGDAYQTLNNADVWTTTNIPFEYGTPDADPVDSINFTIASSGAGAGTQAGSVLELDAIVYCKEFVIDFVADLSGATVDLTSTTAATGNGGLGTLFWDFGDGNTSTELNPTHVYTDNDTYTLSLTVTDSCGNDSTYTEDIVIEEASLLQEELLNTKIYPNPTSEVLNVTAAKELANVVIYNLVGAQVMNVSVSGTESKLNVSELPKGAYLIEMITSEGAKSRKKFIKK